jgi:hypothetical protein
LEEKFKTVEPALIRQAAEARATKAIASKQIDESKDSNVDDNAESNDDDNME